MGGAQKSMLHPYEDLDTTFRELFGFAKHFAKGGTFREKVDGCNLTWRFDGETLYLSRNYEHFRSGGITIDQYRGHLKGHPAEEQFTRALDRLERMRNVIKASQFFDDYDDGVWVNMEVIDSKAPQMLRYDIDCFVIHNLCRFVEKPKPHTQVVKPTSMHLHRFSSILCLSGIRVLHAPTVTIPAMSRTYLYHFRDYVMSEMKHYDLNLDSSLRDLLEARVSEDLCDAGVEETHAKLLAQNVSGAGKHNIREIRAGYDQGTQTFINQLCLSSNRVKTTNSAMNGIKHCWLSFGARRLEGIVSTLITDPEKAKNRLDDIIDWNIDVVNNNREKSPTIYHGFHDQLEKFVSFDVEPQIIEGFVFETPRYIVKLTGAFQSLNRVTGTARYQFGELFEEE